MTSAINLIGSHASLIVALVLAHFIWQGALLAGVLAIWLALANRFSAETRYLCALTVLGAMAICPLVTAIVLERSRVPKAGTHANTNEAQFHTNVSLAALQLSPKTPDNVSDSSELTNRIMSGLARNSRPIVLFWFSGVGILALCGIGGWLSVRRMLRLDRFTRGPVERLAILAQQMGLRPVPRLCISEYAPSALVFGVLRAVIVLPSSAILGLSAEMLDAILAHELAHIRRHDYLVNLFQSAVETMLFYNPAIWWVSNRIREEREFCCDDIVIATLEDRITYARALEGLAILHNSSLAVSASGGSLLTRIERIVQIGSLHMNGNTYGRSKGQLAAGVCAMMLGTGMLAGIHASSGQGTVEPPLVSRAASDHISETAADGPGIIITLVDSKLKPGEGHAANEGFIRDSDLQRLVSELWSAGAQAISIGDQRIDRDARIRAWGPGIIVDNYMIATPIIIRAIGETATLGKDIDSNNGILVRLRKVDPAIVSLETSENLKLPETNPAERNKLAYLIQARIFRFEMDVNGISSEKLISNPSVMTLASMPAKISVTSANGEDETVSLLPGPAPHKRIRLTASYTKKEPGHAEVSARTPPGFTLERGKNTRILGVVSTDDIELKKQVESGTTVRGHGQYTAYYVEVKVE